MNYQEHYDRLISRARGRKLDCYTESHHIIPRCMNGTDDKNNLVELTAREHFIAHILLVKIYPKSYGLIKAVQMMCLCCGSHDRSMNRMYGWLREKFSIEMARSQRGENNSQYGKIWIYNLELKESKKITKGDSIPEGWFKGRVINFNSIMSLCEYCNQLFLNKNKTLKYCSKKCNLGNYHKGTLTENKEQDFLKLYDKYKNTDKALKELGLLGNVGAYSTWAKKVIQNRNSYGLLA